MEQTNHIIAIGYSFNENDEYIINEFNDIEFRRDLHIDLINPSNDLIMKYKKIFKTENVKKVHDSLSDYCKWIIQQPGIIDLTKM